MIYVSENVVPIFNLILCLSGFGRQSGTVSQIWKIQYGKPRYKRLKEGEVGFSGLSLNIYVVCPGSGWPLRNWLFWSPLSESRPVLVTTFITWRMYAFSSQKSDAFEIQCGCCSGLDDFMGSQCSLTNANIGWEISREVFFANGILRGLNWFYLSWEQLSKDKVLPFAP